MNARVIHKRESYPRRVALSCYHCRTITTDSRHSRTQCAIHHVHFSTVEQYQVQYILYAVLCFCSTPHSTNHYWILSFSMYVEMRCILICVIYGFVIIAFCCQEVRSERVVRYCDACHVNQRIQNIFTRVALITQRSIWWACFSLGALTGKHRSVVESALLHEFASVKTQRHADKCRSVVGSAQLHELAFVKTQRHAMTAEERLCPRALRQALMCLVQCGSCGSVQRLVMISPRHARIACWHPLPMYYNLPSLSLSREYTAVGDDIAKTRVHRCRA